MQFMISMKFTDQGIRTIKDAPKRTKAARELAKKLGIEIKHIYLTKEAALPRRGQRLDRQQCSLRPRDGLMFMLGYPCLFLALFRHAGMV